MRVAVFRAAEDGARTAAHLAARGHAAVLAPVIRVERTGWPILAADADAVIFTSAHAPTRLDGDPALPQLRGLPCWCVGARTAAAAAAIGFTRAVAGPGDAAELAGTIRDRLPRSARLLLLAGQDRKPTLETTLVEAGFEVTVAEVYRAEAVPAWTAPVVEQLRGCAAALHYSRRSADLALALADGHGLAEAMRALRHHCLSPDVAEPLRARGLPHVACADRPFEASLLGGLDGS